MFSEPRRVLLPAISRIDCRTRSRAWVRWVHPQILPLIGDKQDLHAFLFGTEEVKSWELFASHLPARRRLILRLAALHCGRREQHGVWLSLGLLGTNERLHLWRDLTREGVVLATLVGVLLLGAILVLVGRTLSLPLCWNSGPRSVRQAHFRLRRLDTFCTTLLPPSISV
jgi:hypothetical protein